ncbi:MAG: hypothetical protein ACRBB2_04930 [Nitrosopumilus sp.]
MSALAAVAKARDTASHGNCGDSVQIAPRGAIQTFTTYKSAPNVDRPVTTQLHYAGDCMENAENAPTRLKIIEGTYYASTATR